jgi:hypothetical protein
VADNRIELEIVLDDGSIKKAFANIKKEAKETGDSAKESFKDLFKIDGLADLNAGLYLAKKAIQSFIDSMNALKTAAAQGEQLKAVGQRFELIAKQAGLIPDALAGKIDLAVGDVVVLDEALKSASKAIINLGSNGSKIPEIFELARKVAVQYGGDTIERFEQISSAIASGNLKTLKEIGLKTDATKVIKEYAEAHGESADNIGELRRQQILLEAVLSRGNTAFKNVTESTTPLTTALEKNKTAWGELKDIIDTAINNTLGSSLKAATEGTTRFLGELTVKIKKAFTTETITAKDNIIQLREQIDNLTRSIQLNEVRGFPTENLTKELEEKRKLLAANEKLEQQRINTISSRKTLSNETDKNTEAIIKQNEAIQNATVTNEKFNNGFSNTIKDMTNGSKLISGIATTAVNGLTNAFAAFGGALVTGKNAFAEFGKGILKTIGQLAIMIGQFMVLVGIAFESVSFLGFQGAGAIAAGLGLIVLGGALQAIGGASGTAGTADAVGGGVGAGSSSIANTDLTEPQQLQREVGTTVNLTVQGDIFDSDATGGRIVNLLNDAFDKNGVVVRGATA